MQLLTSRKLHFFLQIIADSKVHGAKIGPTWVLSAPGARPTKHISIEFEIRWKFKTL